MSDFVRIFDTTLRDGEQAAGINLNVGEKLQIAHQLARLKVDIIEAGFPAASPGDFACVHAIASEVEGITVAGLARTREQDIRAAAEAVKPAKRARIHTFIATSPIHMEHKLKMTKSQVLEEIRRAVTLARSFVEDVEFSAEDASRSEVDFVIEAFRLAVECGATTLNIPDTVGYSTPDEFGEFCRKVIEGVGRERAVFSVHCHDDLGLAVANSLAGVRAGVRQIEGTINGLGERAGNASLEEAVMALRTRSNFYGASTQIDTTKLYNTSRLVSRLTGVTVPPNKAVVGANAFSHEAGIHQHGVLANRETYEIMKPEDVGAPGSELVLGKHSGRHAFRDRVESLGYNISPEQIDKGFEFFKVLCDKKKLVSDGDLESLIAHEVLSVSPENSYKLLTYSVHSGFGEATATVTLENKRGDILKDVAIGNGPVDAAYNAIKKIINMSPKLEEFRISATSKLSDALGETVVLITHGGVTAQGGGASTDVIESSVKAYVNAINRLFVLAAARGIKTGQFE